MSHLGKLIDSCSTLSRENRFNILVHVPESGDHYYSIEKQKLDLKVEMSELSWY